MNTRPPRDLIVFGEDWGSHPSSTQHLIKRLMRNRRVIWVDSIGLRRPRLGDLGRVVSKLKAMFSPRAVAPAGESEPTPTRVLSPRVLPWPGCALIRRLNRRLLLRQLRPLLKAEGIEAALLWISLPTAVDLIGRLGEQATIYYCGDDFGALAGVDHGPVESMERELVAQAALTLAASEKLVQKLAGPRTHLLPHGVDLERFQSPAPRAPDLPPGPVAGFYGSLSPWIDLQLLAALAARLPEWQIVLIGPQRIDLTPLRAHRNIHLLGARPHAALPAYVQHWEASLLPFLDNPQIRAANPLKLREYLAAGRPIVTTDFPALEGYREWVDVAADAEGFAEALERARSEGLSRAQARRDAVAAEGWDARAAQLDRLLEALG